MQNESSDINAIRDRLKYIIDYKCKGNQTKCAELLKLPRTTLNDSLGRLKKFNSMILINMAKYMPDISIHWLLTGEGSMEMQYGQTTNSGQGREKTVHSLVNNERAVMSEMQTENSEKETDKIALSLPHQETQEFLELLQVQLRRLDQLEVQSLEQEQRLRKLEHLVKNHPLFTKQAGDATEE